MNHDTYLVNQTNRHIEATTWEAPECFECGEQTTELEWREGVQICKPCEGLYE